jgi:prolactin regulatory element-binding protein
MGFPVFSLACCSNGKSRVCVGGGGGATKAGVKNTFVLFQLDEDQGTLKLIAEKEFSKSDDGCMSLALHPHSKIIAAGVNCPEAIMKEGKNLNCRIYTLKSNQLHSYKMIKTVNSLDPFHHQKVIQFSPDGQWMLTGTTEGICCIWNWPDIQLAHSFQPGNEITDASFDSTSKHFVVITSRKCMILNTSTGIMEWMDENPNISGVLCEFRAARFTKEALFVVCNAKNRKAAFICKYVKSSKQKLEWIREKAKIVSYKPITAFASRYFFNPLFLYNEQS